MLNIKRRDKAWYKEENARLRRKCEAVEEERADWKKKCEAESAANAELKQSNVELMKLRDELLLEIRELQECVAPEQHPNRTKLG